MKKIGVLLVDDHTVVRQGLRALLKSEEDLEVVGEAEGVGRIANHVALRILEVANKTAARHRTS